MSSSLYDFLFATFSLVVDLDLANEVMGRGSIQCICYICWQSDCMVWMCCEEGCRLVFEGCFSTRFSSSIFNSGSQISMFTFSYLVLEFVELMTLNYDFLKLVLFGSNLGLFLDDSSVKVSKI